MLYIVAEHIGSRSQDAAGKLQRWTLSSAMKWKKTLREENSSMCFEKWIKNAWLQKQRIYKEFGSEILFALEAT